MLFVCVFVPGSGQAQVTVGVGVGVGPGLYGPGYYGGAPYPYSKYGPRPPANWNYPGLAGGPYLTTGYPFVGWPGYRGAFGSYWTNGLSLYGPPVPVYGPIPGVFGNSDLVEQWRARPTLGWGVGWVGVYAASPRPRPLSVSVWPVVESVPSPGTQVVMGSGASPPLPPGGCLILSVKVPQPAAEVFVDGVKTAQTGTDRTFESPPQEPGKDVRYALTARWVERGVKVERTKVATGKPGEVVRLDFTAP